MDPRHQRARVAAAGPRWDEVFYPAVAKALGGPVLELGCGTGRIVRALHAAGVTAWGLERDPALVQAARRFLAQAGGAPERIVQGDMRAFDAPEACRLVLIARNTLAVLDDDGVAACLGCVRRALGPDGEVLLDVELTDAATYRQPPHTWAQTTTATLDGDAVRVEREGVFDPATGVLALTETTWRDGRPPTHARLSLHPRTRAGLEALLGRCGWSVVGHAHDEHGQPVGPDSRLWVARIAPV